MYSEEYKQSFTRFDTTPKTIELGILTFVLNQKLAYIKCHPNTYIKSILPEKVGKFLLLSRGLILCNYPS